MEEIKNNVIKLPLDRYSDSKEYNKGLIAFVDILGFENYVSDTKHFGTINKMFNGIMSVKISNDINNNFKILDEGLSKINLSIFSDSILLSIDQSEFNEYSLDLLIDKILLIRKIVLGELKLDIRAGITYGEFIHNGYQKSIIFGPEIVKAYKQAEKTLNNFYYDGLKYDKTPAMISIDSNIFNIHPFDIFNLYKELHSKVFEKINVSNKDFYIINPFMRDHINTGFSKKAIYDANIGLILQLIENAEEIEHKEKYYIYKNMLESMLSSN